MSILILRLLSYLTGCLLIILTILVVGFNLLREFERKELRQESTVAATASSPQISKAPSELRTPK
jgi:hypothetical protein